MAVILAAVPATCGGQFDGPGQGNYRATITVFNRTEAAVTVQSQARAILVPPCTEITAQDVLVNAWSLSSPGRDSFHSGGGHSERHSYLIVTATVSQLEARPDPLPPCEGLLQAP